MELWDAYDRDGTPLDRSLSRGRPIPDGLYHMVCSVIVRHQDGDFLLMLRDPGKPAYPGVYEPGAGGAALKGEDEYQCIRRELLEETGISCDEFTLMSRVVRDSSHSILYTFCCTTDCDKTAVRLQEGETSDFRWVSESQLQKMIAAGEIVPLMKRRLDRYFQYIALHKRAE